MTRKNCNCSASSTAVGGSKQRYARGLLTVGSIGAPSRTPIRGEDAHFRTGISAGLGLDESKSKASVMSMISDLMTEVLCITWNTFMLLGTLELEDHCDHHPNLHRSVTRIRLIRRYSRVLVGIWSQTAEALAMKTRSSRSSPRGDHSGHSRCIHGRHRRLVERKRQRTGEGASPVLLLGEL